MTRRIPIPAALVLAGGLVLGCSCTSRSNSANVTSGPHGPTSPATSGNYGNSADLAPPYGAPKTAEPNAQSTGGKTRYPESERDKQKKPGSMTAAASNQPTKQHQLSQKPENHSAPGADHGE
ncbi:MAG TPA: hypothetical protein VFA04_16625 [Bryobacteraceae bacterium]|nr:hypothetical protein [Bryobacteraceae bacterium]